LWSGSAGRLERLRRLTIPTLRRSSIPGSTVAGTSSWEFLDGEDLGHMLRQDCRLPADVAVSVTAQVCSALAAAHTAGVVHRDIKPGNVLVRADGRVKVTDSGSPRCRDRPA
jgi:tRNA A-37 threonylcarbamoyl transferase component Bud32